MTLVGARVRVADRVRVTENGRHLRANTGQRYEVRPEQELVVTRVYRDNLMVRTVNPIVVSDWSVPREASFMIPRRVLEPWDPNYVPPVERRLGQKPEDTEDLQHIDKDDPRIAWIWEDLGRYADGKNWCTEYDALCAKIGIPGRPRDFSVNVRLGELNFNTVVKAHSQAEANRIARREAGLDGEPEPPAPEPNFAIAA